MLLPLILATSRKEREGGGGGGGVRDRTQKRERKQKKERGEGQNSRVTHDSYQKKETKDWREGDSEWVLASALPYVDKTFQLLGSVPNLLHAGGYEES